MEKSFSFWDSQEGYVVHPGDCMQQLLEQVRRHKVNIDGNVCAVMVTTLVLEVIFCLFSLSPCVSLSFFHPLKYKVADFNFLVVTLCAYQFVLSLKLKDSTVVLISCLCVSCARF